MGKNWNIVRDDEPKVARHERKSNIKKMKQMGDMIRVTPQMSGKDLREHGENLFAAREEFNKNLLDAFKNKKLKSKSLIREAKRLEKIEQKKTTIALEN